VAHALLTTGYLLLWTGNKFADLGEDYFDRLGRDRLTRRLVKRLERLGHRVSPPTRSVVGIRAPAPRQSRRLEFSGEARCQGDRGTASTSSIPKSATCWLNSAPKMRSRSRGRSLADWAKGNASRSCWAVHSAVGWAVTL